MHSTSSLSSSCSSFKSANLLIGANLLQITSQNQKETLKKRLKPLGVIPTPIANPNENDISEKRSNDHHQTAFSTFNTPTSTKKSSKIELSKVKKPGRILSGLSKSDVELPPETVMSSRVVSSGGGRGRSETEKKVLPSGRVSSAGRGCGRGRGGGDGLSSPSVDSSRRFASTHRFARHTASTASKSVAAAADAVSISFLQPSNSVYSLHNHHQNTKSKFEIKFYPIIGVFWHPFIWAFMGLFMDI